MIGVWKWMEHDDSTTRRFVSHDGVGNIFIICSKVRAPHIMIAKDVMNRNPRGRETCNTSWMCCITITYVIWYESFLKPSTYSDSWMKEICEAAANRKSRDPRCSTSGHRTEAGYVDHTLRYRSRTQVMIASWFRDLTRTKARIMLMGNTLHMILKYS